MNKLTPYKHQNEAINKVLIEFEKEDRTQLIKSCGTGKSLTSMWIHENYAKSLNGSLTVLFYPSLFLVNQTYNTYKDNSVLKFNPLVICSDKAIGENENDDVFEIDVNEVKYPVTTNIDDIKTYLNSNVKDKIVFVTYQSSELVGLTLNELGIKADLGIFDEAHKTATANINSKFAYGLKDENIPIAKRLFMTATPRHIKFNVDSEEVEVFSMNNPELYGNIAYEYPMRDAINDKRITDYKIMGILIDDKYIDSYTNTVKPFSEDVIDEAKIKAVNEAMNKYKLNKALIFNPDIATSKNIEKYSNTSIFNRPIKHLDGSSKHSYREEVLKELKESEQFVITNARLFTEGVDLPTIDMVALFRNVKSEIDIIQTVGRVQRNDKNNPKKVGYILLPIFVSNLENIEEEIKTNKDLLYTYEIINSLKENDEQLRATLEYKKQNKSKAKTKNEDDTKIENPNFEIDYISNDTSLSGEYIKDINEKITHRIEAVILDKRNNKKSDEEWKELFVQYGKEFGIENLTTSTMYKNEHLGRKLFSIIKPKYYSSTSEQQKQMREFWDCFSESMLEKPFKTDKQWKEIFKEYDKEIGIKNLSSYSKYNNNSCGEKFGFLKRKYHKSTPEQQKQMREYWDCFPDSMWEKKLMIKTNEAWKVLFVEYANGKHINYLLTNTTFKNEKIGYKFSKLKIEYSKSTPEQQKQMREYWDCFSKKMWGRKIAELKTDKQWKEIFIKYNKEFGVENIVESTIYNSKKDISSKIFRIIAERSLPSEDFLDNFKKAINNSVVTHKEKIKINGQIHENTINKKSDKTKDDMVFVRGGTAVNGGFIRYDVFKSNKNKFKFVKITPKHCGLPLNELPKPKDLDSLFLFSIYPKTYLNLVYEENKILEETKGLFRKIDGSLYLDSVKNTENEIYNYKLKRLKLSYLLSNDLEPFSKDEIKKITPLLKFDDFEKKAVLKTSIDSIRETLKKIENYFNINCPECKILFVFNKTSCKETYLIKENLLSENILLSQIKELDEIKTIVFNIEEEKLISPYFVLAPTKIKSIKKIKTDTFGNESILLQEKREPLLNSSTKIER